MKRFLNSVDIALRAKDWYGALSTALTLPDICGRIEAPEQSSKARYVDWFNRYLRDLYTSEIGSEHKPHVFLHGEDCYALQCSYLHEGGGSIIEQQARKALDSFHFITPPLNGIMVHKNYLNLNNVLQLQVDIFCREICTAFEKWMDSVVYGNTELEGRLKNLLEIHISGERILI